MAGDSAIFHVSLVVLGFFLDLKKNCKNLYQNKHQ